MCAPLMKAARGEARKTTRDATSCGSQIRLKGIEEIASSCALAWSTFLSRAKAFSRPSQRDARARDQDVEAAELLQGRVDAALDVVALAHVAGHADDLVLRHGGDLPRRILQGLLGARRDHDVGTLGRQLLGYRPADALARPGDQRDLAGQLKIHGPSSPDFVPDLRVNPARSGPGSGSDGSHCTGSGPGGTRRS